MGFTRPVQWDAFAASIISSRCQPRLHRLTLLHPLFEAHVKVLGYEIGVYYGLVELAEWNILQQFETFLVVGWVPVSLCMNNKALNKDLTCTANESQLTEL